MKPTLADLVAEARRRTEGGTGSALVLVLHRLRQHRDEDIPARHELARLFRESNSVAVGPRVAA